MGMYTEFHFNVRLKKDVSDDVLNILGYMLHTVEVYPKLFNHPLFETDRWHFMLLSDSYYFPFRSHSKVYYDQNIEQYYLEVKCSLKNYDNEISHFINWIGPYVDANMGEFLGFHRYEESQQPTLIFKG